MSVQIAVRLPEEDLKRLDAAVARGVFPSRAAAVRSGLAALLREDREREIVAAYRRAYADHTPDEDQQRTGEAGLTLGAQLLGVEDAGDG